MKRNKLLAIVVTMVIVGFGAILLATSGTDKQTAPDFTLKDMDGNLVSLSDYEGKVIILDFWATWCEPCKALVPLLEKLADEYQGKFILAKVDVDQNQQLAGHFGVRSVPTVKLVKDGQIIDEFSGVIPDTEIRDKRNAHIVAESNIQLEQARTLQQQGQTQQAIDTFQQLIID